MLLDSSLESVEKHGNKLLDILLDHYIDRFSKRLVGYTIGVRYKIDSSCFFKISKYSLNLV